MATDYKFEGWVADDATAGEGNMVWKDYEPKPWEETDVDIKITHSGICGSDLHTLRSGWVRDTAACIPRRGRQANSLLRAKPATPASSDTKSWV